LPDAPPFVSDEKEAKRIRELLLKKFDLSDIPKPPKQEAPKQEPPKQEAQKKQIPIKELLMKKFEKNQTSKILPSPVKKGFSDLPDAPPFVSDEKEAKRIRELLLKKFDLSDIPKPKTIESKETKTMEVKSEKEITKDDQNEEVEVEINDDLAGAAPDEIEGSIPQQLKKAIAGLVVIFTILMISSSINSNKYYLLETPDGIEVYKGDFAPMGKSYFITLTGIEFVDPIKDSSYSNDEIFPIFTEFYQNQANEEEKRNVPDFRLIKDNLKEALKYASSSDKSQIDRRLKTTEFNIIMHKAEIAVQNGEDARSLLNKASRLAVTDEHKQRIDELKSK